MRVCLFVFVASLAVTFGVGQELGTATGVEGSFVPPSPATLAERNATMSNSSSEGEGIYNSSMTPRKDVVDQEEDEGLFSCGLDGTNYFETAQGMPVDLSGLSGFTVGVWVKPKANPLNGTGKVGFSTFLSAVSDSGPVMSWLKPDNVRGWWMGMNSDNQFVFSISVPGSEGLVKVASKDAKVVPHRWTYLSASYSPRTARTTLYVNGERTSSSILRFADKARSIDYGRELNKLPKLSFMHYKDRARHVTTEGVIGDVAMWDRALLPVEVRKLAVSRRTSAAKLYKATVTRGSQETQDGPIVFFPFQEGKGSTVADVGLHKLVAHARGVNAPAWVGDLNAKPKLAHRPATPKQFTDAPLTDKVANAADTMARLDEIKMAHAGMENVHRSEAMVNDLNKANQVVGHREDVVDHAREAREAHREVFNRVKAMAMNGRRANVSAATAGLKDSESAYGRAMTAQKDAEHRKMEVEKAMDDLQFTGKMQQAGYSVLHGTMEILGRMLHHAENKFSAAGVKSTQQKLEGASVEIEAESRTMESNRQDDWQECEATDKIAKLRMATTRKHLVGAKRRADLADRALREAKEQLKINQEHEARVRAYVLHLEKQLKRVRTIAATKKEPDQMERRAETLMNAVSSTMGEIVDHEAPFAKKIVPQAGKVANENNHIREDRDWVDTVDWNSFVETEESVPWESVLDKVRWGDQKMVGQKGAAAATGGAADDGLMQVNRTEQANRSTPEFWREEKLKEAMNETKEQEERHEKAPDMCLSCRDEDDQAMMKDLFNWPVAQPKPDPLHNDMAFDSKAYQDLLKGLQKGGKWDNDKDWPSAKESAASIHRVIRDVADSWAGTAAKAEPTTYFSLDMAHMHKISENALKNLEKRMPRLELLVSTTKAAADRATVSVNDIDRLYVKQHKFYHGNHIRCEAKADLYAIMAEKRSKALDAVQSVSKVLNSVENSKNGNDFAVEEKALKKVMGHLQELIQPPKALKKLSPRPWKNHPAHVAKQEPKECSYQVRPGDSLVSIADKFGISEESLVEENPLLANTSYPKLGVWMAVPGAKRGTENCQMKPKGFAASIKFLEPLSNLGFPMPKDTSRLTPAEVKLMVAERDMGIATKKADASEALLHEQKEILRKAEAVQTGGDKMQPEEVVQFVESMPLSNRTKDWKKISDKISLCNTLLNHLESEATLPNLPELDVVLNNTVQGENIMSPELVASLKRIQDSVQYSGSITSILDINGTVEESDSIKQKLERAVAKYFGVHVNQVTVAVAMPNSGEMRFRAVQGKRFSCTISKLDKAETASVKSRFSSFNMTTFVKKVQAVGMEVEMGEVSLSKPVVSIVNKTVVEQAELRRKVASVISALKHAKKDLSARLKVRIAKSIQSLKEDVVKGNVTLVAAEAENENDKKKLQSAEKVVGKKLTAKAKTAKEAKSKGSEELGSALKHADTIGAKAHEALAKAKSNAEALKAKHLAAEEAAATLKAQNLDREEKKLQLREKRSETRSMEAKARLNAKMKSMNQLLVIAKSKKTASKTEQQKIQKQITSLKSSMAKQEEEDAKKESNLRVKILVVDAAEKCEQAKSTGGSEKAMQKCKTAVLAAKSIGEQTKGKVGLDSGITKMLAAMPAVPTEAKLKAAAKVKATTVKTGAKATTVKIGAKASSIKSTAPSAGAAALQPPADTPAPPSAASDTKSAIGSASFTGVEYVDVGTKGFNAMRIKTTQSSGFSFEAWVRVHNVDVEKFQAVISAIGENKYNSVTKKVDGNGPYKKGFVVGYAPSLSDESEAPVWTFGVKGSKGTNPKLSYVRSESPVKLEEWTHIAATYDNNVARLFINGVAEAVSNAGEQAGAIDFGDSGGHFAMKPKLMLMAYGVNGEVPASPCCMEAELSDAAVWGRALGRSEVAAHAGAASRQLDAANSAVHGRDTSVVGFWRLSSKPTKRIRDGYRLKDQTHFGLQGTVVSGGGAEVPLKLRPSSSEAKPQDLTKEEKLSTEEALTKADEDKHDASVQAAKDLIDKKAVNDAQKALVLEAVIAGKDPQSIEKLGRTAATEGLESSFRSRVIASIGGSKKFPEGRKKMAILGVAASDSKKDIGAVLEALLAGRKIEVPGLRKSGEKAGKDKAVDAALPSNINELLTQMRASAEKEAQAKLSGQVEMAKISAAKIMKAEKELVVSMQRKLNNSIAGAAEAKAIADSRKEKADLEMKHALSLAKDAARTHAQAKQHLESHGFSMPSVDFKKNLKKSKEDLAKIKRQSIIDQSRELAAVAAQRNAKKRLDDATVVEQNMRTRFKKCSDLLLSMEGAIASATGDKELAAAKVSYSGVKKQCELDRKFLEPAIAKLSEAKEVFRRANDVVRSTQLKLAADARKQADTQLKTKMASMKAVDSLMAEIQRLQTVAAVARDKQQKLVSEHKMEESNAFAVMADEAAASAKKAAGELVAVQLRTAHISGESAIFKSHTDGSGIDFSQPNLEKWSRENLIKSADYEVARAVSNVTSQKSIVSELEKTVARIAGDLSRSYGAIHTTLQQRLNAEGMKLKAAQKVLHERMAVELVMRSQLMELKGEFFDAKKGSSETDALRRKDAELQSSRDTSSFLMNEKRKDDHTMAQKDAIIKEGTKKLQETTASLVKMADDRLKLASDLRAAKDQLKKATVPVHERQSVSAVVRVHSTKEAFQDNETQARFVQTIASMLKVNPNAVQINDVVSVEEEGEPLPRSPSRRRLLGNIRGLAARAEGLVEVRFRVVSPKADEIALTFVKSCSELATALNKNGFSGPVQCVSAEAVKSDPQGPTEKDVKGASATGAAN